MQHRTRQRNIGGGHEWLVSDNAEDDYQSRRSEEETKGT